MHDLTCGRSCLFYRCGNTNSIPEPAIVKASNGKGRLLLIVLPGQRVHPNIAHHADPWVESHGESVRDANCGVWEFVESEVPQKGYRHIEVAKREAEAALRRSLRDAELGSKKLETADA